MGVQFILGRAGSGKTRWCRDRILHAMQSQPLGKPIYWILPQQATFVAQRELACGDGRDGFFRARVVSFEDLGRSILDECGGIAIPEITSLGRRMILGHLLRQMQDSLKFFKTVARQPGVIAELDGTFTELERCGLDPAAIANHLANDPAQSLNPALAAKLHDLEKIYTAYGKFLGQERIDPARRLNEALRSIATCASLQQADVYVDGFFEFNHFERRVLAGLGATCKSVCITLLVDPEDEVIANPNHLPDEMNLFHRTLQTYRKLWFGFTENGVAIAEPVKLQAAHRFANTDLAAIEKWDQPEVAANEPLTSAPESPPLEPAARKTSPPKSSPARISRGKSVVVEQPSLFGFLDEPAAQPEIVAEEFVTPRSAANPSPSPSIEPCIEFIEAPDRRSEVDAAARWIRREISRGLRYRDLAILMRSQDQYSQAIEASFGEHQIPFFIDRRRTASHHPLLRFIRAALAVARENWPHEAMMTLLKSDLAGLTTTEADALENYVLRHGIHHSTWSSAAPWTGTTKRRISEEDRVSEEDQIPKAARDSETDHVYDDVPTQDGRASEDAAADEYFSTLHEDSTATVEDATKSEANAKPSSGAKSIPAAPSIGVEQIDRLRRQLVDRLTPFVKTVTGNRPQSVRTLSTAIFQLLETFNIRGRIVEWMRLAAETGRLEQRAEHERVWDELVILFDEMVELLGDEIIPLDDFQAILDSALENFDLALTPPTVDQVLVGPVDRTRTPDIKACLILGLGEGQFPRASQEDSVFNDLDRWALRKQNIEIDPDTQRRLLDEYLLGYIAFTRASQRICLTRSIAGEDGKTLQPSALWNLARSRIPSARVQTAPREQEVSAELISTPRQLITSLMRWVRAGGENANPRQQASPKPVAQVGADRNESEQPDSNDEARSWPAVYQWLATRPALADAWDAVDVMRYRAWKALAPPAEASLHEETAKQLFSSPLQAGVAQIESFRNCPFQHFARYGLALTSRQKYEVGGLDLSRIYHDVLAELLREMLQSRQDWRSLTPAQTAEIITRLTQQVGRQLRGELMLSSDRNRYLLDHIERTLAAVVAAQQEAGRRGDFRPAWGNVRFGGASAAATPAARGPSIAALKITTPAGHEVLLRGKIDRIDTLPNGSATVIDYKLAGDTLNASEIYHGLSLQLLTYLLLIQKNGDQLEGKKLTPAAALYVQLLRSIRDCDPLEALDPSDPNFHLQIKPRGIISSSAVWKLDKRLSQGDSEVIRARINKDGTFGAKSEVARPEELTAILQHVQKRIGQIADQILSGQISVRPYRLGTETPCPRCEFRDLCRFDPTPGGYVELRAVKREELFERMKAGGD